MFGTNNFKIVTFDQDINRHLTTKCDEVDFENGGLKKAQDIILELKKAIAPLLPAAGLAAPQIGINQRVFILSWDRSEAHLQGMINPSFTPMGEEKEQGWEACFSTILGNVPYLIANVPRHKKIEISYIDEQGQVKHQVYEGFAARVFQHEYDHLEGIGVIHRSDAEIKSFNTRDDVIDFMTKIKQKDKINYIEPIILN